jgi:cytochrome bd-I ubiquinol oxidase subunit X
MWYFAWCLGVTMAVLLAVVNAMWFEAQEDAERLASRASPPDEHGGNGPAMNR